MRTVKLSTEPFTCPSCISKIENTLGRAKGVEEVQVMFNSSKVKVKFDEDVISADAIAETVTKLGYPVLKTAVA